jgi:hypothetical protein
VVIVAGVLLVAFGIFADVLAGSPLDFGLRQAVLAGAGLLVVAAGLVLRTVRGQRYLARLDDKTSPAEQTGVILLTAVCFGILGGLGELLILFIQEPPHHFVDQHLLTPHAGWRVPLAYVLLLGLPGAALGLAAKLDIPILRSLRAAVSVSAYLVFFGWLRLYARELGRTSVTLLALGLAALVGRLVAAHPVAFRRALRRWTGPLVAGTVVVGLAVPVSGWWRERQAAAREPTTAGRPNVVLVVLDQVRARNMSLYGYARPTTPFLERLAEESTIFDQAISAAPWTLPSHAAMFTGHYPLEMSTDWTLPLDETFPTLAEALAAEGYMTAGFVANKVYAGTHTGLARGFLRYDVDVDTPTGVLMASSLGRNLLERRRVRRLLRRLEEPGLKLAPMVSAEFLGWLDRVEERPFFAFLNYMDAHTSYLPWPPIEGRFASDSARLLPPPVMARAKEKRAGVRNLINQYDERIALLDGEMERLVAELDRRGLSDHTLLIIASDHGEEFGERGVMFHGRSLYLPSLQVPLLLRFPGRIPGGVRVGEPVGLADLPATVLDVLGLSAVYAFPGESLSRHWASGTGQPAGVPGTGQPAGVPGTGQPAAASGDAVTVDAPAGGHPVMAETNGKPWMPSYNPVSRGDMRAFITPDFHYILNGDGVEELYRTAEDPWDQDDLAGRSEYESIIRGFRSLSVGLPPLELGSNVPD